MLIPDETTYTGRELRPGWVHEMTGGRGDAVALFVGPCDVANEDLVDLDDARAGTYIRAASMAHVIVEHPDCPLQVAVLRQRLLVCQLCELLREVGLEPRRDGDDVYIEDRKLTVSIAAPAGATSLIHLGINVDPAGAPVPAVGLAELGIDAPELLGKLGKRYADEIESCGYAETKVREVG